jgi:hypothetical protein
MGDSPSAGQDLLMTAYPFRSSSDRALATSAHQLQRAGGTLQSHAGSPNAVPTHAVTLAHVEEALDQPRVDAAAAHRRSTRTPHVLRNRS